MANRDSSTKAAEPYIPMRVSLWVTEFARDRGEFYSTTKTFADPATAEKAARVARYRARQTNNASEMGWAIGERPYYNGRKVIVRREKATVELYSVEFRRSKGGAR